MTRKRRSPPGGNQGGDQMHNIGGSGIGITVPAAAIPLQPARCWRCGVPFAWTTAEDLARCAEIARREAA